VNTDKAEGETYYRVLDDRRPILDFYRNNVIGHYAALSLVAVALRASGFDAPKAQVRARARWLSRLFKLEFTYRPGATLESILDDDLARLERIGGVVRHGEELRHGPRPERVAFLAEFLRPYLEAYRLAAGTALELLETPQRGGLDRRALVKSALELGRAAFLAGQIANRESLSKATVENAVEWLVSTGRLTEAAGKLGIAQAPADLREIIDGMTPFLRG
jgi:glycerol-3-phosphate O-acyltransferase